MYDLLVTGGTVATATITAPLDVAVQGERIAALGAPGSLGSEARRIVAPRGLLRNQPAFPRPVQAPEPGGFTADAGFAEVVRLSESLADAGLSIGGRLGRL